MKRLAIAFVLAGVFAVGLVAACRQGEGERCQVNDDCEAPLICVTATSTCAANDESGQLDAAIPIDAPDAPPPPIDAPPTTM